MKKRIVTLAILLLLVTPLILAQEDTTPDNPLSSISIKEFKEQNPWNGTIIISPVWQKLVGTFFGLNLKNESTEITVRETIVFTMTFIMFLVVISDILKMTPFFKQRILDEIPVEYVASLIITIIISISGAFINLKNLFISGIAYTVTALDWTWLKNAIANRGVGTFIVAALIVILIVIIHEILSWGEPIIKKYSKISRAEAKGRIIRSTIRNASN